MSDKELLELAAKAAGYSLHIWGAKGEESFVRVDEERHYRWNPLTDDGDALRLAVKLRLMISWHESRELRVIWWRNGIRNEVIENWNEGHDSLACSRYAIVRAAAEIGRNMK